MSEPTGQLLATFIWWTTVIATTYYAGSTWTERSRLGLTSLFAGLTPVSTIACVAARSRNPA